MCACAGSLRFDVSRIAGNHSDHKALQALNLVDGHWCRAVHSMLPVAKCFASIARRPCKIAAAHTMHAFSYVHAFNALSGTCIVCGAGMMRTPMDIALMAQAEQQWIKSTEARYHAHTTDLPEGCSLLPARDRIERQAKRAFGSLSSSAADHTTIRFCPLLVSRSTFDSDQLDFSLVEQMEPVPKPLHDRKKNKPQRVFHCLRDRQPPAERKAITEAFKMVTRNDSMDELLARSPVTT